MKAGQTLTLPAFNRLVQTYQDAAYGLARYLLGQERQAEEVVDSAFRKAYQSLHCLPNVSFRSWLLGLVTRACMEELSGIRRNNGKRQLPVPLAAREGDVQAAICSLPLEQRLLIVLVEVLGLDYDEASNITGWTKEQVRRDLALARYQLMLSLPS